MAYTSQSAGLVRQKAYNAVYGTATSPFHFYAVKMFFLHMAANKGNPDLQFRAYSTAEAIVNNGTDLIGGACTLYAWFGKAARTTGTTDSFQALHDATTNGATTTTVWTAKINLTGQSFFIAEPNGRAIATGLTISAATAVGGATESAAADATTGFVIVGA